MIEVSHNIILREEELTYAFVRSSGPGGQNVNKVASAVQLRFNAAASPNLPEEVKERLLKLAGSKATTEGEIVIDARNHRTQERNRVEALERLVELIRRAEVKPVKRRPTKPSRAAKERRLKAKLHRARIKRARGPVSEPD